MAKCTICNSRKGKRKCQATDTFICSQCCGESRDPKQCEGCSFIAGSTTVRNYRKLPHYSVGEMERSPENERIGMVIENSLSLIWNRDKAHVNDRTAQQLVEMLLDRYHFDKRHDAIRDPVLAEGYQRLRLEIDAELEDVSTDQLVKVLGAVYRSIQRRSSGACTYLQFINRFTGGQYMA